MKRPITVRWWFRVGLICVVLVGGYGSAYALLRSKNLLGDTVEFRYPSVWRKWGVTEQGAAETAADIWLLKREFVHWNISEGSAVCYTHSSVSWRRHLSRVFVAAERFEMWWTGWHPIGATAELVEWDQQAREGKRSNTWDIEDDL